MIDDVDDPAPAIFAHRGAERPRQGHPRTEVQLDQPVPILVPDLLDRLRGVAAGVVDQDVDPAERRLRPAGEPHGLVAAGQVGVDPRHPRPGADRLGGVLQLGLRPAGDHDVGPGLGEPPGHRLAQALAPAGHQGHPPRQVELRAGHRGISSPPESDRPGEIPSPIPTGPGRVEPVPEARRGVRPSSVAEPARLERPPESTTPAAVYLIWI